MVIVSVAHNMLIIKSSGFWDIPADYRVNAVNCKGAMGKGIALEFKIRYPKMFDEYVRACWKKEIKPGHIWVYDNIISFATKDDWRDPSRLAWIDSGLLDIVELLRDSKNKTLCIPALGCSNGGLKWKDVLPLISKHLGELEHTFYIFPPNCK